MKEAFSNGFHAKVFTLSEEEKLYFPHADLVREERVDDLHWFARVFYIHKIAHTLYPEHFIDVVGVSQPVPGETFSLYSRKIPVPEEHATFASHMRLVQTGSHIEKRSVCGCQDCINHRQFHRTNRVVGSAIELHWSLQNTGLAVHFNDQSDYCLNGDRVVFFEIDFFSAKMLRNNLISQHHPTEAQLLAQTFLDRYDALTALSREDWLSGKSSTLRNFSDIPMS